ncbi:MAG: hypothetical protein P1P58_00600, partial [Treponema sp.]
YLMRKSKEVINMLVAEYDYDTDIAVQRQESLMIGIQQGIKQGISQGIERGSYQTKLETARLMRFENLDINLIAKVTGLSAQEIENL